MHQVCKFSVADLPTIRAKGCLLGNKFDLAVDSAAVLCQVKQVAAMTAEYDPREEQNNVSPVD